MFVSKHMIHTCTESLLWISSKNYTLDLLGSNMLVSLTNTQYTLIHDLTHDKVYCILTEIPTTLEELNASTVQCTMILPIVKIGNNIM
jgi:hypothetical protein